MNEAEFAFRIRQALNEAAERVSYKTSLRLERARQLAVARARGAALAPPATVRLPAMQIATAGGPGLDAPAGRGFWSWLRGAGLAAPLLVLAVGFVAIHQWHDRKFISELADVDFAVLLDENPISALADKGFGVLIADPSLLPAVEAESASGALEAVAAQPASELEAAAVETPEPSAPPADQDGARQ